MSQITRCPSCATSFKVVADQLRISEGWVRCGQCKEVFDASAHLLPSAPPSLLPDVSLTDVRPPTAPVARVSEAGRAWGAPPVPPSTPAAPSGLSAALRSAQRTTAPRVPEAPAAPSFPPAPSPAPMHFAVPSPVPSAGPSPVLEVPTPAVPAFLTARSPGSGGELSLEPVTPFAWRPPLPTPVPSSSPPLRDVASAPPPPPAFGDTVPAPLGALGSLESGPAGGKAPAANGLDAGPVPGGYELPFAELRDSDWPADGQSADESAVAPQAATANTSFPAIDVPVAPTLLAPSIDESTPQAEAGLRVAAGTAAAPSDDRANADLPPVDFLPPPRDSSAETLALVADDSVAAVLRSGEARPSPSTQDGGDDEADPEHAHEVSFVRAARRQAFWRQRAVRLVLSLLALTALLALALQVAVQERDRIAAMDVRARPWLVKLCVPLQCEIAPRREIADVVIDSSSFNKARGDSYQLALTLKSQSSLPLAMPAIELTLTDAQDQPVLRRVLLPTDMAAPAELPARGEWSASVAVIVTTGGARVAGYRVLAFYP